MQNSAPPRALGRAIAGVLSGAAANLRSRFAILSQQQQQASASENAASLPATLPSMVTPVMIPAPASYQGEQLPSMLPVTVPGAAEPLGLNQSFPSSELVNIDSGWYDVLDQGCQMVNFQSKNPNLGQFWRALEWKMLVYLFNDHLEYFTAIWYNLRPFGIICGRLVYICMFVCCMFGPRKICQSCSRS
jgi:hypothetical protein